MVGAVPDGLRIDWRFVEARFVGPVLEGAFLPGAADWMRIRTDGVAIVQVQGCIETRTGARIYTSYGGISTLAVTATIARCAASSIHGLRSCALRPTRRRTKN